MAPSRRPLRNFFIGKQEIKSRSEYKRLMLTGYMSLICIAVAVIYTFVDIFHGVYYALLAYGLLLVVSFVAILLIRAAHFRAAKICLMLSANLVVFWGALNDPFETGTFLFFIPTGLGSFAILGFAEHRIGFILAGVTTALFLLAYFSDLQPFPVTRPSEAYIQTSFILNYFISLTIAVLAVYFLINLNHHSESELITKENLAKQKNAELQNVNEALDRFVYSVSHDLRSPLSSILGLTNIAAQTDDPAEMKEILSMIQGRIKAQDHFISEIIDYARNARTEIVTENIALGTLVDDVISSLRFNVNAERIQFRKQIPNGVTINSDRIRLTMVLSNLIGNAIKYFDARKEQPFIEIGYSEDLSAIYVEDNGIGILPEQREKIFNMFYRGSDRSTGSGLGLFITREAVMKLGGKIDVRSSFGQGSTFIVTLPHGAADTASNTPHLETRL